MTNDKDRSDAHIVTWRTARGDGHRIVFEPLADGGYERIEERFEDGQWKPQGREIVTHVDIEAPRESSFLDLFPRSQTEGNDGRI